MFKVINLKFEVIAEFDNMAEALSKAEELTSKYLEIYTVQ